MIWQQISAFFTKIPPPFKLSWNANNRAITFAWLMIIEMLIHGIWYAFVCLIIHGQNANFVSQLFGYEMVDHQMLHLMVNQEMLIGRMIVLSLMVLCFSGIAIVAFQRLCSKSVSWYVFQTIYIFVCSTYYTFFTQYFGEHTIINGLNFTIGIVLGLLLLDKLLIIFTFSFCLILFVLISLNRKLDWLPLDSFYMDGLAKDYWFWTISYMYFTVTKIIIAIYSINFILFLIHKQQQKIHKLLAIDGLTSALNRRSIYCFLDYLWQGYDDWQRLSVIYFDLDYFKQINDDYGHDVGDYILVYMTKLIKEVLLNLSPSYQLGRLGGEEFVVLLPNTHILDTMQVAETLRQEIAKQYVEIETLGTNIELTASFGVAGLSCPDHVAKKFEHMMKAKCNFEDYLSDYELNLPKLPERMQSLLSVANTAMHHAKQHGRNQVVNGGDV